MSRKDEYSFISITPVETLQGTEAKVRTKLYHKGYKAKYTFDHILGDSAAICKARDIARQYACHDATVLITGESGTGKELFAQSIHNMSPRAVHPFLGINFAALAESLAESELFGYEEGAFTGASRKGKAGIFKTAHKGTIFLDEIGDASLSMQTKLLRVLEEREVSRVGSAKVLPVDVRLICATNKDLPRMVRDGEFRKDLYYRIRVLALRVPALRGRKADIPLIAEDFCREIGLTRTEIQELIQCLNRYDWSGNIRELKSVLQFLAINIELIRTKSGASYSIRNIVEEYMALDNTLEDPCRQVLPWIDKECLAVLHEVYLLNKSNTIAGRYSLAKREALSSLLLSESRIKTRLKKLQESGLVITGKTKQGAFVSDTGIQVLKQYADI